jgi:hypothetical protein
LGEGCAVSGAVGGSFEGGSRFVIAEDVLSRRVGDETIILDLETERYFGLTGVGTRLWQLLDDGMSFDRAVAVLSEEYGVDAAIVERDIREVLDDLLGSDLVVVAGDREGCP